MKKINFSEMVKLVELLKEAGISYEVVTLWDGLQTIIYKDGEKVDDAVLHGFSHGHEEGLLETFCLGECEGYETAEQVFKGWKEMLNF